MLTRKRIRAERAAAQFRERTRDFIVPALLGDGAGNVKVTGRANWVWVRLDGSGDDVTQALNRSSIALVEDAAVDLRRVRRYAAAYYEILGASTAVIYDTITPGDDGSDFVKAHAPQHERRDGGEGGSDPLDVYARMVVPLRARAQDTPDLTVHVESGYNPLSGNYIAEQDSSAVTPPSSGGGGFGNARWDLLYLDDADALQILQGTVAPTSPTKPPIPENCVPLAYVYLTSSTTEIEDSAVYDARLVPGARVSSATDPTAIHVNVAGEIAAVAEKTIPADADVMISEDSAASNAKKRLSWTNIKATLKTYFDTLYAAVSHTHTHASTTGQTANDHHAQSHDHTGADGTPKLTQARTHESHDTDAATTSLHHTLGTGATQAAAGDHTHASSGTGDRHLHGLARWVSAGGATFDLPDVAEYVDFVTDAGLVYDPTAYTLSADRTQITFDSAPAAGRMVTANYVIASI